MSTIANLRDPMVAVKHARQAMQAGEWRGPAHRDGDLGRALHFLKTRYPAAHQVLPPVAVAALTKNPPSPGCHWCTVHMLTVLSATSDGADAYPPRDALPLAWLGSPCSTCQARHDRADAIAASLTLYHELVAEGVPERVAAMSTTREAAYQHMAEMEAFKRSQLPRVRRPAGTLQAGGRLRPSDPPYFRRGPWPAEDTW